MPMTVSIVTVTYNSEGALGATMDSILNQTYPGIEYLIIDGASSDGAVALAESYRERMEQRGIRLRIVSEKDRGLYDAMNKGICLATGDVIGILNSNDWYELDTVETVVKEFEKGGCDLLFSDIRLYKANGRHFVKKARLRRFQTSRDWNHPTMFVKSEVYKGHPFRNQGVHDDYGCYLQLVREGYRIRTLGKVLANFRMGGISNRKNLKAALRRIRDRYLWCYRSNGYSRWYLVECIMIEIAKMIFW